MIERHWVAVASLMILGFVTPMASAVEHTDRRAGGPRNVAPWAHPAPVRGYVGGYIGGGAAVKAEPRLASEGTWGWDYRGKFFPRRVLLGWWHGRKYQGGPGAYKTDGGPPIPPPPILRKL